MKKIRHINAQLALRRRGVEESPLVDVYHRLLRLSWLRFFALVLCLYLVLNTVFAFLYWLTPASIAGIHEDDFISYFAFSVQTTSTVGYGHYYPQSHLADILVMIQTGFGLFFTAVLTGLVFAKFSTPVSRIVFSRNMILTVQNAQPVLSVRLGNFRSNRIFEGRARVTLLRDEVSLEGERLRRMVDLKLQRSETPLFALSWTLFHVIDEHSPLHGETVESMSAKGWDMFVTFKGFDEDFERDIVAHASYPAKNIVQARKFADMINVVDGIREIDYSKLHDIEV